ncbi:MAG TPA: tetratricopeptide repeat protein, partial [Myxococcota bacterium]|nr:tetratricopeptide repeat protein [Myxococcota bacterium]
ALTVVAVAACVTLAWTAPYRNPGTFYAQAVQSSPHLPSAHVHLADTLIGVDDARAEAGYLRALELHPAEKLAHNNLGVLYLRRGALEAAEREFTAELERAPDYAQAWYNLALVQSNRGDGQKAEALLLHALSLNPDYTAAYSQLAGIYASRGDQTKLLRALEAMERLGVQITTRPATAEP